MIRLAVDLQYLRGELQCTLPIEVAYVRDDTTSSFLETQLKSSKRSEGKMFIADLLSTALEDKSNEVIPLSTSTLIAMTLSSKCVRAIAANHSFKIGFEGSGIVFIILRCTPVWISRLSLQEYSQHVPKKKKQMTTTFASSQAA